MVLLNAPSGYGKSVLLAQWAEHDPRPFASIILGDEHNDPAMLVDSIVKAFDEVESVRPEVSAALAGPRPDIEGVVLPRLGKALAERKSAVCSRPGRARTRRVAAIPSSRVVIGSHLVRGSQAGPGDANRAGAANRQAPSSPWPHRVGAPRPRDDQGRMQGAPRPGLASSPSPKQLDMLVRRTEGWPVALYLAGLALREERDLGKAIAKFEGDDRIIVDYIREEFLGPVSRRRLEFLRRVSVLDRLSGSLCDAASRAHRLGHGAARPLPLEHAVGAARPAGRVVPLPRPIRRDAALGTASRRAAGGGRVEPPSLGLVGRARRHGPGDQSRHRG